MSPEYNFILKVDVNNNNEAVELANLLSQLRAIKSVQVTSNVEIDIPRRHSIDFEVEAERKRRNLAIQTTSIPEVQFPTFGSKLRAVRKSLGLSLREFGNQSELDPTFLGRVERGKHRPTKVSTIVQMAQRLGLRKEDVVDLINLSGRVKEQLTIQEVGILLGQRD